MKNEKLRSEASGLSNITKRQIDLPERLLAFVVQAVHLTSSFPVSAAGSHISLQLVRAATSVGANYEEACAAESRADFIHKMQVALKEAREMVYWLKLAEKLGFAVSALRPVKQEAQELLLILAKSVVTSKGIRA